MDTQLANYQVFERGKPLADLTGTLEEVVRMVRFLESFITEAHNTHPLPQAKEMPTETETTQDNCRKLVDSHVYANVSYLVQELSKNEKYMDELSEVQVRYDDEDDDYGELEAYPQEALEHWVVSDWLANRLREQKEMVIDFYGLTIWGRTTSGQAIYIDSVIEDIYNKNWA